MASKSKRESNIELLRVVVMLMVVITHLYGIALGYEVGENSWLSRVFFNCFFIIPVHVFIFISGYYGITFRVNNLISLVIQALFYTLGIGFLFLLCGYPFTPYNYLTSILPISTSYWWFLSTFIALYLLTPFLNLGIEKLSKQQLLISICGIAYLNYFSGFAFEKISNDGYSIFNFICIYLIAAYLKKYDIQIKRPLLVYLIASLITFAIMYNVAVLGGTVEERFFNLNSPFITLSAIAFFFIFKNLKVGYSATINKLASLSFGVYLIHAHRMVWAMILEAVNFLSEKFYDQYTLLIALFLLAIVIFVACIAIEQVRQWICKPMEAKLHAYFDERLKA
ncbi:MAG: hypothetical protein RL662_985 [Bacteroidota bacterium]|jgi:surface polysaccharide O-acyltransferase-like enzyme